MAVIPASPRPSRANDGFLAGSAIMAVSAATTAAGNALVTLLLGRWLGPAAYADVGLAVGVMLTLSVLAAVCGQTMAWFTATSLAAEEVDRVAALRAWIGRAAWITGGLTLLLLVAGAAPLMRLFHTLSPWPFVLVGLGMPLFLAQSVARGVLQGYGRFGALAVSYQAEMIARLLATAAAVALGWGALGAIAALPISFAAAWLVARRATADLPRLAARPTVERRVVARFAGPIALALVGQALLTNGDLLVVRHVFAARPAGLYVVLTLVGRLIATVTWSVSTALFPLAASRLGGRDANGRLFRGALGLVAAFALPMVAVAFLCPRVVLGLLVGAAYVSDAPLLGPSALAATLCALARVAITHHVATGRQGAGACAALAGVAQIGALWIWHASLAQVVVVQVGVMAALCMAALLLPRGGAAPAAVAEAGARAGRSAGIAARVAQ